MKNVIISLFLLAIGSCKISDVKLAMLCDERFPNRMSDTKETRQIDSTHSEGSITPLPPVSYPVQCPASQTPSTIEITLPGGFTKTDTIKIKETSTVTEYDSVSIFLMKERLLKSITELDDTKADNASLKKAIDIKGKTIRKLWIALGVILLLIGLFVGYKLYPKIKGFKTLSFFSNLLKG